MRVIGHHEHSVASDRHATIGAAGGVADQALCPRPLIPPDLPARARVERITLVRARHVHHAGRDDRRDLQRRRVRQAEDPFRRELRDVAFVDVCERAVAAAAGLTVVAGPVSLRRDLPVLVAALAEQVQRLIVAQQLHVDRAAIEDEAFEHAAASKRHLRPLGPRPRPRAQRADVTHDVRGFPFRERAERGHAGARQPLAKERRQVDVASKRDACRDSRAQLTTVAVAAVTARASRDEHLAAGVRRLRRADGRGNQREEKWNDDSWCAHGSASRAKCSANRSGTR